MAKFRFAEWLLLWLQENSVRTEEAEEVFTLGQAAPLGVQVRPLVHEERLGIVGTTTEGRILHVVFTLRDGKVRPISARPAHKKERAL